MRNRASRRRMAGMIVIYTGNGKGKTSACIGHAVRAAGHGIPVAFGQFIKRYGCAGEQAFLHNLLKTRFHAKGKGFLFKRQEDMEQHQKAARELLDWALDMVKEVKILILDESLYALNAELISNEDIKQVMAACAQNETHLVLSGRYAPEWLIDEADTVTEMHPLKHAFSKGIPAQKGIDF